MTQATSSEAYECDGGIEVRSGGIVYPLRPEASLFDLSDIAHALGHVCRFGGHTVQYYSVAEHCLLMLDHYEAARGVASDAVARTILLHDASEAFLGDMVRPLKQRMPEFREIEARLQAAIEVQFQCAADCHAEIARMDVEMLAMEQRCVMHSSNLWPVTHGVVPADVQPRFYPPHQAAELFYEVCGGLAS